MKIYTKTGDDGSTLLFGGGRVSKAHIRIEAYGTVDELNSFVGLVLHSLPNDSVQKSTLNTIQNTLFVVGALLATNPDKGQKVSTNPLNPVDITYLEKQIDSMDAELPPLRNCILPAGSSAIATCHIARCVCRRAERNTVALAAHEPVEPLVIEYLNRLSDYLFTLARYIAHTTNTPETPWITRQ